MRNDGGTERPWQSSSWVPTPFPAGGGVEALWVVDVWLTDTGLTVSAADRWKITIQLECDESELRAIPRISTLTVTDWSAEAGCPSPLPEWWVSYLLFTPSLVFNVGTFLTGYIFIILKRAASYLHLSTCNKNAILMNNASDIFLHVR